MKELIETLEAAGYTNNHGFPDDYYVKGYSVAIHKRVTSHGHHCLSTFEPRFAIITIHDNYDGDGYEFAISHAGPDWIEPVDFYCSPNHKVSSLTDTIWEANQIINKHEG